MPYRPLHETTSLLCSPLFYFIFFWGGAERCLSETTSYMSSPKLWPHPRRTPPLGHRRRSIQTNSAFAFEAGFLYVFYVFGLVWPHTSRTPPSRVGKKKRRRSPNRARAAASPSSGW